MIDLLRRAAASTSAPERLGLLLEAWRACRHPRLAEVIERLTTRLLEGHKPIKGKSMAARVEAIAELCAKKDPVDVGRVLVSEWPGTWQTALPMLEAIVSLPDDPRVARALAEQVELTRYDTWTSKSFYAPLFRRLNELRDVRQLPLLEAQLGRNKTYYYQRDMRPLEERAVELLRAVTIEPLSAEADELIRAFEAPFATEAATEQGTERDGERLLAAVFERPTDLAARAVYGDWLTERKDPRGELISLQLAPPTEKSLRRVEALIKKHWQTWLGPLADWFRRPPTFEAGFPVEGQVDAPHRAEKDTFLRLAERPEWSTFRRLTVPLVSPAELVQLPRFRHLAELPWVSRDALPALLEVGSPALRFLEVTWGEQAPLSPGAFAKLPALEVLRLQGANLAQFHRALPPTLTRLELVTNHRDAVDSWAPLLEGVRAETILDLSDRRVRLLRDGARGPFLEAQLLTPPSSGYVLEVLPLSLERITSATLEKASVPKSFLDGLTRTLARFPRLTTVDLPFVEEAAKPLEAPHVELSLSGFAFFEEARLEPLWKILTQSFRVTFDTLEVRGGLSLGDDPLDKLRTWCRNKRCRDTALLVQGAPTVFRLLRDKAYYGHHKLPLGDPERFISALDELLAFSKPTSLAVGWANQRLTLEGDAVKTRLGEVHALLRSPATTAAR